LNYKLYFEVKHCNKKQDGIAEFSHTNSVESFTNKYNQSHANKHNDRNKTAYPNGKLTAKKERTT